MRLIQSAANAYAAITAERQAEAPQGATSSPVAMSPGRSKSWRRASSSDQDHDRGERAVVDAVQHVQGRGERGDSDRDLPGPVTPPNEAARGDEQRDGRDDAERVGERPDGVGREVVHEAGVLAGQHRVDAG